MSLCEELLVCAHSRHGMLHPPGIFLTAGHLEVGGVVSRLNRVSGEGSLDMETVLNLKRWGVGGRGG